MDRDRDEWRRPWGAGDHPSRTVTAPDTGATDGPTTAAAPTAEAPTDRPAEAPSGEGTTDAFASGAAAGAVGTATIAQPRPLAPPSTWDAADAGPGSPPGSVRPPDTLGTVDPPPRRPRRGAGTALLAALLGAVIGTGGTLAVVGTGDEAATPNPTASGAVDDGGGQVQAPTIDLEGLEDTGNVVPAVARAVLPSVVRIDILGAGAGGAEQELGLGSGVVYRSDGYIITNNHVVEQADSLRVKLSDGQVFDPELIGTDPRNDLAVLKIDATGLPAVNLRSDSDPVVGETAIAIGSPFGLDASVTAGVVSATGRDITVPAENDQGATIIPAVVQTDAAINPGNSGGALVDREGRLLGINTAILSGSGGSQGVGFAIPVATAVTTADQLIETGEVRYPLLGVRGSDVTPEIANRFELDEPSGALMEDVTPNSGAAEAGLEVDDIVIAVDDEPVTSMQDLVVVIRSYSPGDTVDVTFLRDGQQRTVEVTLGELEDDQ